MKKNAKNVAIILLTIAMLVIGVIVLIYFFTGVLKVLFALSIFSIFILNGKKRR